MSSKYILPKTQTNVEIYNKTQYHYETRPVITREVNEIWSCDLYDLNNYEESGYRYILNCIDLFSRKWFYSLLKGKTIADLKKGFADVFHQADMPPKKLWWDKEPAVVSYEILERMELHGIEIYHTSGKSVMVESFHRTLGNNIVKALGESLRGWVKFIPEFHKIYNNTVHSSIKCTPNEAYSKKDGGIAREKNDEHWMKPRKEGKLFKNGDRVRIQVEKPFFAKKSRTANWSSKIYHIIETRETNPRTYKVNNMDKWFYAHQLFKSIV